MTNSLTSQYYHIISRIVSKLPDSRMHTSIGTGRGIILHSAYIVYEMSYHENLNGDLLWKYIPTRYNIGREIYSRVISFQHLYVHFPTMTLFDRRYKSQFFGHKSTSRIKEVFVPLCISHFRSKTDFFWYCRNGLLGKWTYYMLFLFWERMNSLYSTSLWYRYIFGKKKVLSCYYGNIKKGPFKAAYIL